MNKNKKKFIQKLKKQSKDELISIICEQYEDLFHKKNKIEYLESLVVAHQQTLKFALNHQNPKFIYEISEDDGDDEPDKIPDIKEKDLRSYV